jgi:putative hydrolase of the HAD superfamily
VASLRGLPAQVEAVLLDAGGVLLDLDFAFLRRVIAGHHLEVAERELARVEAAARFEVDGSRRQGEPSIGWRDFFHLVLARAGVPAPSQTAIVDVLWDAHQRVGLWTVAPAEGPPTVAALRGAGLRLAVVSNAEGQVARDLDAAGYAGMFDAVVDSHIVGVRKPDPRIFHLALERLGVAAQRAVHLGDVPQLDVAGAKAAGVAPILLDRHDFYDDRDAPRIRSLGELPQALGIA